MATSIADVIEALNFGDATHLAVDPLRAGDRWSLYEGTDRIRHVSSPFALLHIDAGCQQDDLLRVIDAELAALEKNAARRLEILTADGLDRNLRDLAYSRVKLRGRGERVPVLSFREYLRNLVGPRVDKYRERLQQQEPKDFVPPHLLRGGERTLTSALQLAVSNDPGAPGTLSVVLGEPGQGKTYQSKYLACANRSRIAVYVDSTQWLMLREAESIYKTILNSFRHYDCALDLADGREQRFLEIMLDAGIMSVIFDGLDEYVLWSRGSVRALDVVDELARLARATRASVVVTCRTSFWRAEVGDSVGESAFLGDGVAVYEIAPFDESQARRYFDKKLPDEDERRRALVLFQRLQESVSREFLGRGFLLRLIADVARGNAAAPLLASKMGVVRWLAARLCEREVLRQRLDLSGEGQMDAFSLVLDLTNGRGRFSRDDVLVAASEVRDSGGNVMPSNRFIDVLREHPLVRQVGIDSWEFRDDQLRLSLVAELVLAAARDVDVMANLVLRLMHGGIHPEELAAVLADACADPRVARNLRETTNSQPVGTLVVGMLFGTPPRDQKLRRCATELACLWVDQETRVGRDRAERTRLLRSLFASGDFDGLVFSGTVARFDFRGCTFRNCVFSDVHWRSCEFDGSTRFLDCSALGGSQEGAASIGSADWSGSTELDLAAREFIARLRATAGAAAYTFEMLRADIVALLRKFVGPRGVKSIRRSNLRRGVIVDSPHVDVIVAEFERQLLNSHRISSISEDGLAIKDECIEDALFYSANGVMVGRIDALAQVLARRLRLSLPAA